MAAVTASKTKEYWLQRCRPVNIMECKIGYNPDIFSQLPNDILVRLVSQLPVKDAVATSILSSRWQYIWTWTTNLDFDGDLIIHDRVQQRYYRNDFIKWVNSVIDKHNHKTQLERFRVCFDLSGGKTSYIINKWIKFAMKKGVQILELMFFEGGGARGCSSTYVFSSNEFKSLKVLSLICVNVSQEVLESLLSNCPLERLEVAYSLTLINLRVKGPSLALKHLKLGRCGDVKSIEICDAINLVTFYFSCIHPPSRLVLRNVPKLVDIDIHWFEDFYIRHALAALSCCVSQLQIFHLHHLTPYNEEEDDVSYPILTNLKELKLSLNASDGLMFHYIVPLMEKAPNLQRLVVKLKYFGGSMNNKKPCAFWKPAKRPYHCLKEVEVTGYLGPPNDELILYFIESAVSLEKIIVNPCESVAWPMRSDKTDSSTIKREEEGRDHALRYIKEKIPKTIEFVCL